jgi:MFS family permease
VPLRRNRDFVLLQAGQLLSSTGSQATSIAYPLLVLAVTHSAVRAGLVAFARALPLALLAIPAGLAADRWNRKAVMISADAVRVVAMGTLVLSLLTHHAPYWLIVLVAFVEGSGSALFNAAQPGALRSTVPGEQLPDALGAQTGRQAAVMMAGPPLGGGLFEVARTLPFGADVISYAFSTLSLLCMRTPFQEARPPEVGSLRSQAKEGMAFVWRQPFIRASAFLYGMLNFTAPGLLFCIVVIGKEQGRSGAAVGGLVAGFAACILVGSFLTARIRRLLPARGVLLLEIWAWLGCAVFLAWPSVYVLAAGLVPVGLVVASTDSVVHGYRLAVTPDRLLGRSESVRSAIALLLGSLSPLAAGLLLSEATPRWTIFFFTACGVGLVIWAMRNEAIRTAPDLQHITRSP